MNYTVFYYPRKGVLPWCLHYTIGQNTKDKTFETKEQAETFIKEIEAAR
jgi:hypothetical protein